MKFPIAPAILSSLALACVLPGCQPAESPLSPTARDAPTQDRGQPNILFIVADDVGFTDLGAFGSEIATPNLDRLAHAGLRLTNLHAGPSCQGTRMMLMSGAPVTAVLEQRPSVPTGSRGNTFSLNYANIPELLQEAGYATYMAGKWDIGPIEGYTPAARGFDRSFALLGASGSYFGRYFMGDRFGYEEDGRPLTPEDLPEDFYATRAYTDKILEYVQSTEAGTPWFAYLPYTAGHWPLQLPDDWLDRYAGRYDMGYDVLREQRYARALEAGVIPAGASLEGFQPVSEPWSALSPAEQRRYARAQEIFAGTIEYMDMSVGRIVDYLEESDQLENTVVVFMNDHGASAGEQGVYTGRGPLAAGPGPTEDNDNSLENFGRPNSFIDHGRGFGEAATAPFKYQKGTLNEGGLLAAAFVHYPAAVAGGAVSDAFLTVMDILPAFMEIAGTEHPGAGPFGDRRINAIVGRSAWPLFTGESAAVHPPTDAAGWTQGNAGVGALIRGNYKIINQPPPGGGMRAGPWQLYDLAADPGERLDLAAQHPELVADMVAEWETSWR